MTATLDPSGVQQLATMKPRRFLEGSGRLQALSDYSQGSTVCFYDTQTVNANYGELYAANQAGSWHANASGTTQVSFNSSAAFKSEGYSYTLLEALTNAGALGVMPKNGDEFYVDTWYEQMVETGFSFLTVHGITWITTRTRPSGSKGWTASLTSKTLRHWRSPSPTRTTHGGEFLAFKGGALYSKRTRCRDSTGCPGPRPLGKGFFLRVSGQDNDASPTEGFFNVWSSTNLAISVFDIDGTDRKDVLFDTSFLDQGTVLTITKDGTQVFTDTLVNAENKSGERITLGVNTDATAWYSALNAGDVLFFEFDTFPELYYEKKDRNCLVWSAPNDMWEYSAVRFDDLDGVTSDYGVSGVWKSRGNQFDAGGWSYSSATLWLNSDSNGRDWTLDWADLTSAGTFYARISDEEPWTPVPYTSISYESGYTKFTASSFPSAFVVDGPLQFSSFLVSKQPFDGDVLAWRSSTNSGLHKPRSRM